MSAIATPAYPGSANQIELTPPLRRAIETAAASNAVLASDDLDSNNWNSILRSMFDWITQPKMFEADDFWPPSSAAIVKASLVAKALQRADVPLPVRVIPSADEGVAFEWKYDGGYRTIEVGADGSVELLDYYRGELHRRALDI